MEDFIFIDGAEERLTKISMEPLLIQEAISLETLPSPSTDLRSLPAKGQTSKGEIRTSLRAATADGVFATLFANITGGVLLTNFLLELGASPTEIGFLASIPLWAGLMQPLGAYFSEQLSSRRDYGFWVYSLARSLWITLAIAIFLFDQHYGSPESLIATALAVNAGCYCLGALGSASWMSWMAVIVPSPLRGRYFSVRNSIIHLTNLISIPLIGLGIVRWQGGPIQGYGVMLIGAVLLGLISLGFQQFMVDVNPQIAQPLPKATIKQDPPLTQSTRSLLLQPIPFVDFWQNSNFLKFLIYVNLWAFSVNLSGPFFSVYLLNDLHLNISQVTLYNSFFAIANLLLLMVWGKLADRVGNRPILLGVGIGCAIFPSFWLLLDANPLSLWLLLPLLHLFGGGTASAIDLCSHNLQLAIVPTRNQSMYFAILGAFVGISGALGTILGGFVAQFCDGGLGALFILSSVLRLIALFPLIFVTEKVDQ
ncbi:MAG: MFS transporter [Snowella sp.]|nr:MFS transporter [Snowella sp.]